MTMYAKMICMVNPQITENDIGAKKCNIFQKDYFSPEDVSAERIKIKKFCEKYSSFMIN